MQSAKRREHKRGVPYFARFEVPVVFERDVAQKERVFVDAEQEDAQRRQIGAVEQRDYQHNTRDVAWYFLQFVLDDARALVRRQTGDTAAGVRAHDVQHPGRRRLRHSEERRVVVLQLQMRIRQHNTILGKTDFHAGIKILTDSTNSANKPSPTCCRWRRGVAVERRIRDQEVAVSSLGRALRRKNSGQVSHTYVPLSPSSITWYRSKGGDALRLGR